MMVRCMVITFVPAVSSFTAWGAAKVFALSDHVPVGISGAAAVDVDGALGHVEGGVAGVAVELVLPPGRDDGALHGHHLRPGGLLVHRLGGRESLRPLRPRAGWDLWGRRSRRRWGPWPRRRWRRRRGSGAGS